MKKSYFLTATTNKKTYIIYNRNIYKPYKPYININKGQTKTPKIKKWKTKQKTT